ncbi:hypothetical protein BDB00DRAFT_873657 [Zychaea mexicana]|uniref:uncharacterized protein n=1 Tax=Zychaea mexicana TaxID=64656 RepID=UPI0022FDE36A|nr:uncharacterized protein BDB00DRAFT_873657 [Zychaea mexicana]KAI9492209.1 hypothetical protein BDB00DRAFT_873657 [Zychaea mexicana]
MSNKAKGKLAFTVRKTDTGSAGHDTKVALPKAQQPAVLSLLQRQQQQQQERNPFKITNTSTNTSTTPTIPSTKKNNASSITKRKRKAPETKNHSITQFFTMAQTQPSASYTTTIKNTLPSGSMSSNTTNTTSERSTESPISISDSEENIVCHIRYMHPVQEIWTTLVGEYEESLDDHGRRVRPRAEGHQQQQQGRMDSLDDGAGMDVMLLLEECMDDDMGRQVRYQMSLQESISLFKAITSEFLCA